MVRDIFTFLFDEINLLEILDDFWCPYPKEELVGGLISMIKSINPNNNHLLNTKPMIYHYPTEIIYKIGLRILCSIDKIVYIRRESK